MGAIRVDGLAKSYGSVRAVDGMSFTVERGELYGFLGPNGAGKTTTIRTLTGQVRPDAGDVRVLETDPVAEPIETRRPMRGRIGPDSRANSTRSTRISPRDSNRR